MRIKTTKEYFVEGQILKKGTRVTFEEEIFGNYASVYHRTNNSNLIFNVFDKGGFLPGGGQLFGRGFYSTYDLPSQGIVDDRHGQFVVKFFVPIENFLILDKEELRKSPLDKKIQYSEGYDYIFSQLNYFGLEYNIEELKSGISLFKRTGLTKFIAQKILPPEGKLGNKNKIDGVIFTAKEYGKTLVCFNMGILVPRSIKHLNDNEFEKIKMDKGYLSRYIKKKSVRQDRSITPEDLRISSYEKTSDGLIVNESIEVKNNYLVEGRLPIKLKEVRGEVSVDATDLIDFHNFPEVAFSIHCVRNNRLKSLVGFPKKVLYIIEFRKNGISPSKEKILSVCDVDEENILLGDNS